MTHKNSNFSDKPETGASVTGTENQNEKKNRFPTPPWQKNKPATNPFSVENKRETTSPAPDKMDAKPTELPTAPDKKSQEKPVREKKENVPVDNNKQADSSGSESKNSVPAENIAAEKATEEAEKPQEKNQEKPQEKPQVAGKIDVAKLAEEFINVRSELFQTKEALKKAEENLQKAKDAYISSIAEFDNYRRRANEERPKNMVYAKGDLAKDFFPILDNFKLGIEAAEKHHPEAKEIVDGFGMIANQLKNALAQHGIVEINPVGKPFNPNEHESLSVMPSEDAPEDSVLFVHRVGYKIGDRLLRPASVVIAGKPE